MLTAGGAAWAAGANARAAMTKIPARRTPMSITSALPGKRKRERGAVEEGVEHEPGQDAPSSQAQDRDSHSEDEERRPRLDETVPEREQIGRASCRERGRNAEMGRL